VKKILEVEQLRRLLTETEAVAKSWREQLEGALAAEKTARAFDVQSVHLQAAVALQAALDLQSNLKEQLKKAEQDEARQLEALVEVQRQVREGQVAQAALSLQLHDARVAAETLNQLFEDSKQRTEHAHMDLVDIAASLSTVQAELYTSKETLFNTVRDKENITQDLTQQLNDALYQLTETKAEIEKVRAEGIKQMALAGASRSALESELELVRRSLATALDNAKMAQSTAKLAQDQAAASNDWLQTARAQLRELEAAKVSLDAQLAALEIQLLTKTQDAQRFEARAEELSALANGRALELAEAENALRASKGEVEKVRETIRVDELKFQTAYERVIAERDEARQALQRVKAELADMADLNMPLPDVVKKKRVLQTELSVATERVLQLEQTVYENKKAAYATQQASEVSLGASISRQAESEAKFVSISEELSTWKREWENETQHQRLLQEEKEFAAREKNLVLLEGCLNKRGGSGGNWFSVQNWKQRWFCLTPAQIEYFEDSKKTKSLGLIPIRSDLSLEESADDETGFHFLSFDRGSEGMHVKAPTVEVKLCLFPSLFVCLSLYTQHRDSHPLFSLFLVQ